ncbi:MAG: putative transport system permease protein [Acidobacteriaceae bacterium]|nr:putative transport system permease protein [Acidobacteriaceae bacterium]
MNWIRQCLIRRRMSRELKEEIQEHLAEKLDTLMAGGMPREEAERQARRAFGNVTRIEERSREAWMWPMVESIAADARFAFRGLRKDAGFSITTCLTIALGIGLTTAIFSLVQAVVLRPLPFPEQDKLMWLKQQDHSLPGVVPESLSYPDYFDWRAQTHTFSGMASYAGSGVTLKSGGQAQRLDAQIVSANFFQVLGTAPMLGRDFRWEEEKAGNRTVMLSYPLWQSMFGSATDVAGRTIRLDDHAYTVAGVMPRGFQFPLEKPAPALWLSIADHAEGPNPRTEQRGFDSLNVIGRLKPDATVEQARADLSVIARGLARTYPDSNKWYTSALVEPELQHMVGDTRLALQVLSGAVLLVLLIACANVAGLLLARGSRRKPEFALRAAIGASRAKIVRQLLVESVVISLWGGLAGVVLAYGLLRGMARLAPLDIPRMEGATIDGSVLLFAVGLSFVSGLLFGVLPAWRMSELEPVQALRDGTRNGRLGKQGLLNGLVIAQTAIGLVLLTGSGLLIRSFVRTLNVDPGFDPKQVLTARMMVNLPFDKLNHDGHVQFYTELLKRVSVLPGVKAASAGWPLPMAGIDAGISFSIGGRPVAKADHPSEAIGVVMPGFFETMRIPLLAGRTFEEQDSSTGAPVMIINRAFADKYFPHENPIGKHVQVDLSDDVVEHPMREVVGLVGSVKRRGLTVDVDPQYYLPYGQAVITDPFLTIRTSGEPAGLEKALQAALHEVDKSVPLYQVSTLEDYISKSAAAPLFQTLLLSGFAGIALLLSAIGLYGLLSYLVVQRTPEIGLRLALGAQKGDVLGMIVRRGLTLAVAGLVAGLFISAMMTRLLSGMLYGIRPSDPITFVGVTAILLLVSLAATGLPAYRAACLDPLKTLRAE